MIAPLTSEQRNATIAAINADIGRELENNELNDSQRAKVEALQGARDTLKADRFSVPPRMSAPDPVGGDSYSQPAQVRGIKLQGFRGTIDGKTAEERAFSFGHWIRATLSQQMPQRFSFKESQDWVSRNLTSHSTVDQFGSSNVIPTEYGSDLIANREMYGVARKLLKVRPMLSGLRICNRAAQRGQRLSCARNGGRLTSPHA